MELNKMIIDYYDLNDDLINIILLNDLKINYHHSDAFFSYNEKLYIISNCYESYVINRVRSYIIDNILSE